MVTKKKEIRSWKSGSVKSFVPFVVSDADRNKYRVKTEFQNEVNINTIMAKARNGQPPTWLNSKTPRYGDFANRPTNFQDAFDLTEKAREAFYSLPIEFRRELDHDPSRMASAPKSLWEKHGLLKESAKAASKASSEPQAGPEGAGKGSPTPDDGKGAKSAPSS